MNVDGDTGYVGFGYEYPNAHEYENAYYPIFVCNLGMLSNILRGFPKEAPDAMKSDDQANSEQFTVVASLEKKYKPVVDFDEILLDSMRYKPVTVQTSFAAFAKKKKSNQERLECAATPPLGPRAAPAAARANTATIAAGSERSQSQIK